MRIGVDSYSFHRFFGEFREGEEFIDTSRRTADFILENEKSIWDQLGAITAKGDLEVVMAWGHPGGLEMGLSENASFDMRETVSRSADVGISLIRIVVGTYVHWNKEHPKETVERVAPILHNLCKKAEKLGVEIAVETHCDLPVKYLLKLLEQEKYPMKL